MALALLSPSATPAAHHVALRPLSSPPLARITSTTTAGLAFFSSSLGFCSLQRACATGGNDGADLPETKGAGWLDAGLLRRVSGAADADQALDIILESAAVAGSVPALEAPECNAIIAAALDRGNVDLALSVFEAMRSSFTGVGGSRWVRPNVQTYALLVQRLAAALRVSEAIRIIDYVSHAGISSTEEVPFGMIIRCPTCMIAVAVAQPQDGTQVVCCSKCRYQYELFSGDITSIESEEVRRTAHHYIKKREVQEDLNKPSRGRSGEFYKPNTNTNTHYNDNDHTLFRGLDSPILKPRPYTTNKPPP